MPESQISPDGETLDWITPDKLTSTPATRKVSGTCHTTLPEGEYFLSFGLNFGARSSNTST